MDPTRVKYLTSPQSGQTLRGLSIGQVHKSRRILQGLNIWQVHKVDGPYEG